MSEQVPPKSPRLSDVTLPPPSATMPPSSATMPPSPGPASISGVDPGEEHIHAGKRINKYLIRKMIGKGGMGAVYEAMDIPLQRKVALKILPREFSNNEEALQRFIREAQLAARLQHPNAVAVFDVGKKGTLYYIAMELVVGPSGQQILEGRKLDWKTATQAIIDACRGLAAAHMAGLVHRDIKPGNLLFAPDGSVKVSDFGLAKPTNADNLSLTRQDAFVGTPLYMSPEQCRNDAIDHRTDIYSLGATYFTLLTGEAPYAQGSAIQILFAHCSAPIPDPATKLPDLPPLCAHIIRRAMSKHPQDRYQNARDMQADLEALLAGATDAPITASDGMESLAAAVPAAATEREPAWVDYQSPDARKKSRLGWYIGGGAVAALLLIVLMMFVVQRTPSPAPVAVTNPKPKPPVTLLTPPTPVNTEPVKTAVPAQPVPAQPVPPQPTPPPPPKVTPAAQEPPPSPPPAPPAIVPPPISPTPDNTGQPAVGSDPRPEPPPQATPPERPQPPGNEPPPPPPDQNDQRALPMREYGMVKSYAADAAISGDNAQKEIAAQTLILWSDFFLSRPVPNKREGEEARAFAEKLKPGIGVIQPRKTPAPGGPPLPPSRDRRPEGGPGGGPGTGEQGPPDRDGPPRERPGGTRPPRPR